MPRECPHGGKLHSRCTQCKHDYDQKRWATRGEELRAARRRRYRTDASYRRKVLNEGKKYRRTHKETARKRRRSPEYRKRQRMWRRAQWARDGKHLAALARARYRHIKQTNPKLWEKRWGKRGRLKAHIEGIWRTKPGCGVPRPLYPILMLIRQFKAVAHWGIGCNNRGQRRLLQHDEIISKIEELWQRTSHTPDEVRLYRDLLAAVRAARKSQPSRTRAALLVTNFQSRLLLFQTEALVRSTTSKASCTKTSSRQSGSTTKPSSVARTASSS